MAVTQVGFPLDLLSQPWSARIHHFRAYTMAHPRLVATREALLNAIHEVPANSLILVFGPTGVGKTTLRAKIEQLIAAELLPVLEPTAAVCPSSASNVSLRNRAASVGAITFDAFCFRWMNRWSTIRSTLRRQSVSWTTLCDSCRVPEQSEPNTITLSSGRLPIGVPSPS